MNEKRVEHNREVFELWLITHRMRLSTRPPDHPDAYNGRVGKPGSVPGQDLSWIEAISTPDAVATDAFLRKSLKELEAWKPQAHDALDRVYLARNADEALPEQWRKYAQNTQNPVEKRTAKVMGLHLLEDAFDFVLYRCHARRMLLIWPSPERAKGMVRTNEDKKRTARYLFVQARERGEGSTAAVRAAYLGAKCSETAVWKWRQEEGWEQALDLANYVMNERTRCPECGRPRPVKVEAAPETSLVDSTP